MSEFLESLRMFEKCKVMAISLGLSIGLNPIFGSGGVMFGYVTYAFNFALTGPRLQI